MSAHLADLEAGLWIGFLEGLEKLGPPGQALDLSPAGGEVAAWLSRLGWRVTVMHPDPEVLETLHSRAGEELSGARWVCHDPFGPREMAPLEEKAYDLAVGFGLFERALSTVDVDSVLYGLARVLKPDGRALVSVRHEAPVAPEGALVEYRNVGEEDPSRPDNFSPLIPLVEVIAATGDRHLLRLWEMSEIHQAAHRCLMDLSYRWKHLGGQRSGPSVVELRVPPPYEG